MVYFGESLRLIIISEREKMILDVDQVVRRILADLEKGAVEGISPRANDPVISTTVTETTANNPAKEPGVFESDRPLLSLADLKGRLEGVNAVLVPAKAVVTPSARDELRKRNIELRFSDARIKENTRLKPNSNTPISQIRFVLHALKAEPTALLEQWKRERGIGIFRTKCIIETLDHLCNEMNDPAASGIVLSRHTAIAIALANRRERLRAVLAYDPVRLAKDAEAIGANILVADPEQLGQFKLGNALRIFLDGSPRECPQLFRR